LSFLCPRCGEPRLEITASAELAPDPEWDEESLQTVQCEGCALVGVVRYSESRRGALDSEVCWHEGHEVPAADYQAVRRLLEGAGGRLAQAPKYAKLGQLFGMRVAR